MLNAEKEFKMSELVDVLNDHVNLLQNNVKYNNINRKIVFSHLKTIKKIISKIEEIK